MKFQKHLLFSLLIVFLIAMCGVVSSVYAQGVKSSDKPLSTVANKAGVTESDIGAISGGVIGAAISLVGLIFLILMVYAGILWMTARGKEEQVTKARDIIIASIIGLVIVTSAYAITVFVTSKF